MPTEYRTITEIAGPLIFVEKTDWVGYGELVEVGLPDGTHKRGQVLDSSKDIVVVQVFEGTAGIDRQSTVKFLGETIKLNVSRDMLGRILSGGGEPIDGGPPIVPEKRVEITGSAINPYSREHPAEFIQTGISTIDGLNTLVRGQKLPLFSGAGLPHNEVALQIARQAKVLGSREPFGVVFAAMGITHEEARVFMDDFERTGALRRAVLFLNLADDPAVERLITPRMALTAAEYLAYEVGMHILVILTDMTNYAEALRQIGAAREEVPGRRGYPGYMYSVDGSRNVVVKDPNGRLRVLPIRELFREATTQADVASYDGFDQRVDLRGWKALGVTPQGESVFRPITQVVRHPFSGKLIRLRTRYGETIVTPNHSVFTIDDGRIRSVPASEMMAGSLLAHVNRVPSVETERLSPKLASLLGYYVSEGHATRYQGKKGLWWNHYIRIDNNKREIINDIRQSYRDIFGAKPSVFVSDKRSGTLRASIGGKKYYDLFVNEMGCGTRSTSKRIPSRVLSASPAAKRAFFNAYYAGDGKATDRRYRITQYDMVTVSPGLRDDLTILAKQMMPERIPSIYKWKGRDAWKVYLSTFIRSKSVSLRDSFAAEVAETEEVEPSEEFVYDLSVEGTNNFVDGCGGIVLHNTDLATMYERAGRIHGRKGSITQIPIMSIPDDDWTHPIADLTGYITEGQIAIARDLHRKAIYPPVDPLPSLSRLMDAGIGKDRTREDHKQVADQLYAAYAEGKDVRGLVAIVGKEALSDRDRKMLEFADRFEQEFIRQGSEEDRTIEQTLEIGWKLLATLDEAWLTKVDRKTLEKYHPAHRAGAPGTERQVPA
jgi:vacuolar-type H+-ATPase subunit B/Vma2